MNNKDKPESKNFSIGKFKVYPSKNLILEKNKKIQVTPKVMAVLIALSNEQGHTISKDALIKAVWGDITVSDMVLSKAISDLRKAFGDTAKKQDYIKTVSKKGYVLIKEITWLNSTTSTEQITKPSSTKRSYVFATFISALLGIIAFSFIQSNIFNKTQDKYNSAPLIKNITADAYEQRHPRISFNGKYVAYFEQNRSFEESLILKELSTGTKKTIKVLRNKIQSGVNKGLSFNNDDTFLILRINYAAGCKIMLIELATLIETELKTCPYSNVSSIDYSPNKNAIITTQFNQKDKTLNLIEIDIETSQVRPVAENMKESGGFLYPRYSNSGTKLASVNLIASTGSYSIVVTDLITGKHKTVHLSNKPLYQVLWGETDNILYFVLHDSSSPGIWRLSLNDSKVTLILNSQNTILDLDYSSITGEFIYALYTYNNEIVHKIKDDDKFKQIPLNLSTTNNISPTISNNEQYLAYISRDSDPDRLFIHSLITGSNQLIYTSKLGRIDDISWSQDSQLIMLTEHVDSGSFIKEIELKSGIVSDFGDDVFSKNARLSKNSLDIYWMSITDGKNNLNRRSQEGDDTILFDIGELNDYQIGASDRVFTNENQMQNRNISLLSYDKGNPFEFTKDTIIEDKTLGTWTVVDENIYYLVMVGNKKNTLYSTDLQGNNQVKLDNIFGDVNGTKGQLSISRDHKHLFITVVTKIVSDLYLMKDENVLN